jgi:hypothetical protein
MPISDCPQLEVGCPGDRGAFELHWTAGGRPLAVRGAVGVCLGRNDVARASRCDWLPGLGSSRSKPAHAGAERACNSGRPRLERVERKLVSQEQTKRRPKQLASFSWISLPLFEVIGFTPFV